MRSLHSTTASLSGARPRFGLPVVCTAGAGVLVFLLANSGLGALSARLLLFLALLAQGILFTWTLKAFWAREQRDLFHPLVYISLVGVLPMNLIKGTALLLGSESSVSRQLGASLIPFTAEALAAACVGMGFLTIGYMSPVGDWVVTKVKLPKIPMFRLEKPGSWLAILLVSVVGTAVNYELMRLGRFGSALGTWDESKTTLISLLLPLSRLFAVGLFLAFFCTRKLWPTPVWKGVTMAMLSIALLLALMTGGRSALFSYAMIAIAGVSYGYFSDLSMLFVGRLVAVAAAALVVGVIFGSTFRDLRTSYGYGAQLTPTETLALTEETSQETSEKNISDLFDLFSNKFLSRLSAMEQFAVTLDRADSLKAQERALGMDNNIIKETFWAFIPRPLYPNKPIVSNFGLHFSQLYLDSPYRSWAGPSIFGDLYRNFGWWGIPLGMFLLGVILRVVYLKYVLQSIGNGLSNVYYYLVLTSVGYEGVYSTVISGIVRMAFLLILTLAVFLALGGISPARHGRPRMAR